MLDCKKTKNIGSDALFLLFKIVYYSQFELYKNTHNSPGMLCKTLLWSRKQY